MGRESTNRRERKIKVLLEDLGRALLGAISESASVSRSLKRLSEEGYTLHVLLDCRPHDERPAAARPAAAEVATGGLPPPFRIDRADLDFLRSVGIDPTRRRPARRPSAS